MSARETATGETGRARRRRRPDTMLLLVAGIFATYVVLNVAMLLISLRVSPELVSPQYYERAARYDRVLEAREATARTGWRAEHGPPAPGGAALAVRIVDAAGEPVTGLRGTVTAYRPSDAALDQELGWRADAAEPGLYHARFERPAPGLWRITLDLRRGGARFYHSFEYVAPQAAAQGDAAADER